MRRHCSVCISMCPINRKDKPTDYNFFHNYQLPTHMFVYFVLVVTVVWSSIIYVPVVTEVWPKIMSVPVVTEVWPKIMSVPVVTVVWPKIISVPVVTVVWSKIISVPVVTVVWSLIIFVPVVTGARSEGIKLIRRFAANIEQFNTKTVYQSTRKLYTNLELKLEPKQKLGNQMYSLLYTVYLRSKVETPSE